jgi:hypothetical protein
MGGREIQPTYKYVSSSSSFSFIGHVCFTWEVEWKSLNVPMLKKWKLEKTTVCSVLSTKPNDEGTWTAEETELDRKLFDNV